MPDERFEPLINSAPYAPPYVTGTTAERLRERARRIGPFGLDYISAAELRAIADELDGAGDG